MSVSDVFRSQSGVSANVSVEVRTLSVGDLATATPITLSGDPKTLIKGHQVCILEFFFNSIAN